MTDSDVMTAEVQKLVPSIFHGAKHRCLITITDGGSKPVVRPREYANVLDDAVFGEVSPDVLLRTSFNLLSAEAREVDTVILGFAELARTWLVGMVTTLNRAMPSFPVQA